MKKKGAITYINGKPYMGSPMALTHLTLSDLERSKSRSPRFQVKVKGAQTSKPYIS